MTLTELRYIVALAQEQHFGRAAQRCFVSQPTLSIAVKKLEDELGLALFERSKSAVYTTPAGEPVIEQARRVLEETQALKQLAEAGQDQLKSPLRLGAIHTVGPYLFPLLVPQIRRFAPQMPLYLEENQTEVLRERLKQGELDAIVIALPFAEADVVTRPLYHEPFDMLLPRDHPWLDRASIAATDLKQTRLLMLGEGHCFRDQVLQACPGLAERRQDGLLLAEGGSLETIRYMVASGLGATVLPRSALRAAAPSALVAVRHFSAPEPQRVVALAWRASFPRPDAIEALCNAIKQCEVFADQQEADVGAAPEDKPDLPDKHKQ